MKKLIIAAAALALGGCINTGEGEKIGIITKIAKQGIWCSTWEAEIVRGGFSNGTGAQGRAFLFTIESDEMAAQIKEAMENQREVKIHYRSEMATVCRSESGSDFLTKVEILEKPKTEGTASGASNDDLIERLLQVQAQLIAELAKRREK